MKGIRSLALLVCAIGTSACFHAVIETGLPASGRVISKPWAHSFVYGLVPPAPIDASNVCRSGVSKVETQHSFVNGLVAMLTWSLYTPIKIDVTCAADRAGAKDDDAAAATNSATTTGTSTIIRFGRQAAKSEPAPVPTVLPE